MHWKFQRRHQTLWKQFQMFRHIHENRSKLSWFFAWFPLCVRHEIANGLCHWNKVNIVTLRHVNFQLFFEFYKTSYLFSFLKSRIPMISFSVFTLSSPVSITWESLVSSPSSQKSNFNRFLAGVEQSLLWEFKLCFFGVLSPSRSSN